MCVRERQCTQREAETEKHTHTGNVGVEAATRNAGAVLSHCGRDGDVLLYRGAPDPLVSRHDPSQQWAGHGTDGLGGVGLSSGGQNVPVGAAPGAIAYLELAEKYAGRLEVLALGPLTNLALAVRSTR